jgi:carbamoyltransferase
MKDILNAKVKFREWFRPFAPVCREEMKDIYFENAFPSEYMSFAPNVKKEYQDVLTSITHVDGTARLQTVNSSQHKLFYDIL